MKLTAIVLHQNAMVVVLSDLHLDQQPVLDNLEMVFSGYEAVGAHTVRCGRQRQPCARNLAQLATRALRALT